MTFSGFWHQVGNNDLFYFKGDGRLGIGVTDPDSSIEISNAATANLHLEGGTDAGINIDAESENHYSDIDFSLDGQKQGAIRYDHNNIGISEKMILKLQAQDWAEPREFSK